VKKCSYCGRENSDESVHCRECGTGFVAPPVESEPARPGGETWLEWLAYVLRFAGTILFIGFLYLLSFGPVLKYCCTKTITPPPPSSVVAASGSAPAVTVVSSYTVRYPAWVSILYYPIFSTMSGGGGNGLYWRYLQWCDKLPGR
jgi:hypothetical protein